VVQKLAPLEAYPYGLVVLSGTGEPISRSLQVLESFWGDSKDFILNAFSLDALTGDIGTVVGF